ncbi:MAG: hypothetical protein SGPRY_013288 [Prymnesium sp.]
MIPPRAKGQSGRRRNTSRSSTRASGQLRSHDLENHSHIAYWLRKWQGTQMGEMIGECEELSVAEESIDEAPAPAPETASAMVELSAHTLRGSKHNIKKQMAVEAAGLQKRNKKLTLWAAADAINEI